MTYGGTEATVRPTPMSGVDPDEWHTLLRRGEARGERKSVHVMLSFRTNILQPGTAWSVPRPERRFQETGAWARGGLSDRS